MVKSELFEAYMMLYKKRDAHEKATRLSNFISSLGFFIFYLSIIPFLPAFLQVLLNIELLYIWAACLVVGFLLLIVGQRITAKNLLLAPSLSPNEKVFLNVYDTLSKLDNYCNNDGIEFSRVEAKRCLSKVEKALKEPARNTNYLWKALTKDIDEELRLLKRNIKEVILPTLSKGKKEDVEKVYSFIEKLAFYFLNPTLTSLKDLNEAVPKLPSFEEKRFTLISFLERYPKLRYACIEFIIVFISFIVYYIGVGFLNISVDNAYIAATATFGTLTAGYVTILTRKQ